VELRKESGLADQNRPLFNEMAIAHRQQPTFTTQSANIRHGVYLVVTASGFVTALT
jgi:hypothetical protein